MNSLKSEGVLFNGDPIHKRTFLETYRPVDWLPEWYKTLDMTDVAKDPNLLRGGRIRFYNVNIEDIMIEEVEHLHFKF